MVCSAEAIANHWAFVVPAYLTAFGAWAAASVYDFITPTWTTVRDVRRHGLYHLGALLFPMSYMGVYITFQGKSCDYKEMSAGIVALLFACVDFLRTTMGLWQLHMFKQWVMRAVRSIESLGYVAELVDEYDESTKQRGAKRDLGRGIDRLNIISDAVRVNDMIVENRLTEGAVRCFVRCRKAPSEKRGVYRFVWLLRWIEALFELPRVLFRAAVGKSNIFSKQDLKIFLEPSQAEDIWLRWACVLVSQVFPKLPQDMKKSGFMDTSTESALETNAFEFAKGILISAALNTQGLSTGMISELRAGRQEGRGKQRSRSLPHDFLKGDMWENYPDLCGGIFSQQEFLKRACDTGCGLPFGAPHPKAKAETEAKIQYTYSKFETKLVRTREMLTVEDFERLGEFNAKQLEWLAIVLSVDNWNPTEEESVEDVNGAVSSTSEASYISARSGSEIHEWNSDTSFEDSDDDAMEAEGEKETVTGIAVENLLLQLGLRGQSEPRRSDVELKSIKRFPLLQEALEHRFLENRNVLEASLHIDNFLALSAGDQYAFMIEKQRKITEMISDARESLGLGNPFIMNATEADDDPRNVEFVSPATENEQERLLYQFANRNPEFSYFDQRMTFLGCGMESLRSSLAEWVEENSDAQHSSWTPHILSPAEDGLEEISFSASDGFRSCIGEFPFKARLATRYSQMRLIFELQRHLHRLRAEKGLSPSSMAAIALCVLSFPSLRVMTSTGPVSNFSEVQEVSNIERGLSVLVHTTSRTERPGNETTVLFSVPLSPQPVHVTVRLKEELNDCLEISFYAAVGVGEQVQRSEWEAWRTEYLNRLGSMRKWQVDHKLPSAPLMRTEGKIGRGLGEARVSGAGTGKLMNIWLGWLPPRPSLSLFELKTKGFITRQENVNYAVPAPWTPGLSINTGIGKKRQVGEKYDVATNKDIEHASFVGRGILEMSTSACAGGKTSFRVEGAQILSKHDGNYSDRAEAISAWQVRLQEAVSVHTGVFSSLKTAVRRLCDQGEPSWAAKRAAEMIETFSATVGTRKELKGLGYPVFAFNDDALAQDLFDLLQAVLERTQYSSVVAKSMAEVVSSFSNYQSARFTRRTSIALRQAMFSARSNRPASTRTLESVLGSILCRTRPSNHTLPLLLVCGKDLEDLSPIEWLGKGETQLEGRNNMLWPALSLELFCLGIFAARNPSRIAFAGGSKAESGDSGSRESTPSNDMSSIRALLYEAAFMLTANVKGVNRNSAIAIRVLQRDPQAGDNPTTLTLIANLLCDGGDAVEKDVKRAVDLYSRAVDDGGDVRAIVNLQNILRQGGYGVDKDVERALELYSRPVNDRGYPPAMSMLGATLSGGWDGTGACAALAEQLFSRAIYEGNSTDAMYCLGLLLECGLPGVLPNPLRAADLYAQAVSGKNEAAKYNLAVMKTFGGDGIPPDPQMAAGMYQELLTFTPFRAIAANNLGVLCEHGLTNDEDGMESARGLYRRACGYEEHPGALFNFAVMLKHDGSDTDEDGATAANVFARAVNSGGPVVDENFGEFLRLDDVSSIVDDRSAAVVRYKIAIMNFDDVRAMNNLAVLLFKGAPGVPADPG